jgi:hypothetical protein
LGRSIITFTMRLYGYLQVFFPITEGLLRDQISAIGYSASDRASLFPIKSNGRESQLRIEVFMAFSACQASTSTRKGRLIVAALGRIVESAGYSEFH